MFNRAVIQVVMVKLKIDHVAQFIDSDGCNIVTDIVLIEVPPPLKGAGLAGMYCHGRTYFHSNNDG